jgi:murein DD-endopeptidase MepM/ murein hydrolase activator NlpD
LVRDGLRPLLFPPKIVEGDIRPFAGNYVVLQGEAASVLMAHVRRGSLRVRVGQRVEGGQLVAEVGNSGNSLAPHLHVQVMDGPNPLAARIIPFRVSRYERWDGAAWEPVQASPLRKRDRVRVRP